MRVYISGPISGVDEFESHIRFGRAERMIINAGHTAINPRRLSSWGLSWDTYMKIAQEILYSGEVDAMLLLKGWEKSKGATIEKVWAEAKGIQILEVGKP